jgi:cell division protein FtsL
MLKLLLCLFCGVATAAMLLQLRQQRLNLNYETDRLHNQIEATQARLWTQQLNIAAATAPNAIEAAAKAQDLKLTFPKAPVGRQTSVASDDAEE